MSPAVKAIDLSSIIEVKSTSYCATQFERILPASCLGGIISDMALLVIGLFQLRRYLGEAAIRKIVTAGHILLGVRWLIGKLKGIRESKRLARLRQKARDNRKRSIEHVTAIIRGDEEAQKNKDTITKLPPLEIVDKIKKGELTSLQVLRAFQAKTLECHERTNAVCYFFEEAEEWARACDANPVKEGRLFGLPISVKDHFNIKGYVSLIGCARAVEGNKPPETCLFVKCFLREGAVPFVRTNVPQLMMSVESSNPIYGATVNPHNPSRGPGGSSSGEGALVAFGASPMGIGSDTGGSVRHPANFCGCCGFKPTSYRLSLRDNPKLIRGQTAIMETYGPLAMDVDTIVEACKCLWDNNQMFEADHKLSPLMFNHELYETKRPLKIGVYTNLPGYLEPVPAVRRALDMATSALQAQGHTLVPWTPPGAENALRLWYTIMLAHEGKPFLEAIENDKMDPAIAFIIGTIRNPRWLKKVKAFIQSFYNPTEAVITSAGIGIQSALGYFEEYEKIQDLRDEVDDSWKDAGLDAVLCPPMPFPAMLLKTTGGYSTEKLYWDGVIYQALYNVLCLPAGIVPVTKVTGQDVHDMVNYPKKSPAEKAVHFGMDGSEGLPLTCQIVGQRFRDEMVLRVMKEVETGLRNN